MIKFNQVEIDHDNITIGNFEIVIVINGSTNDLMYWLKNDSIGYNDYFDSLTDCAQVINNHNCEKFKYLVDPKNWSECNDD